MAPSPVLAPPSWSIGGGNAGDQYGTIIGTYGPGIEFAGRGNDTLVNSGAIIGNGGTAVQFGSRATICWRLKAAPASAAKWWRVAYGGVNTLEFLSSTIATTGFYNFQIIEVANGAGGALTGYNIAQYITNHGSLTNSANHHHQQYRHLQQWRHLHQRQRRLFPQHRHRFDLHRQQQPAGK